MSKWQYALAALQTIGFFGALIFMMFSDIEVPESMKDSFKLLIGALIAQYSTVISYFFGSSKGSADKNVTIHKALEKQ